MASARGTLQGELDGELGWYGLALGKMVDLMSLGGAMLGKEKWAESELRHFVGKAAFGCCFRRPLFAVFEAVFAEIQDRAALQDKAVPKAEAWDEVALMVALVPLMFTNLRAKVDPEISVTDASPMCTLGTGIPADDQYPCPALCGATLCSLSCVLSRREVETQCPRRSWRIPKFGEQGEGPR